MPLTLLIGCAGATSDPVVRLVCPDIVQYSQETQVKAAEELGALPTGSVLPELIRDYGQLRDRIRICQMR